MYNPFDALLRFPSVSVAGIVKNASRRSFPWRTTCMSLHWYHGRDLSTGLFVENRHDDTLHEREEELMHLKITRHLQECRIALRTLSLAQGYTV